MPGQTERVIHFVEWRCQSDQNIACIGFELGATQIEHRAVELIDDLYAQPFGRDVDQQLVAILTHHRIGLDHGFQTRLQRKSILDPSRLETIEFSLCILGLDRRLFLRQRTALHLHAVTTRHVATA